MQQRVFRFGMTGLIFILLFLFWCWIFGGNLTQLLLFNNNEVLLTLIGLVSTPAIGFIISSTATELWEFVLPGQRFNFLDPEKEYESEYYKILLKEFPNNSGIIERENNEFNVSDKEAIFLNHQILMRKDNENNEAIAWSTRRIDIVYIQVNIFYSIILSFILATLISFACKAIGDFNCQKLLLTIPVISYSIISFRQIKRAFKESSNFEKRLLVNKYKTKGKKS